MIRFLKKSAVVGLSVFVLAIFSNTYHSSAHGECCSTEAECCMEAKCPAEGTCKKLPEAKEELNKIKEELEKHLSDPKIIEKGDETLKKIKGCLLKVNKKLATLTKEEVPAG